MHDGLRVNSHVNTVQVHAEQVMRLKHFESLVDHGCRVGGDDQAHVPGGVCERLRGGHVV